MAGAATGTRVVEVEVVVGDAIGRDAGWLAAGRGGVELDEAVKVKTRTKRRTGLDHITQWALLSECASLIIVL
ncbi:MAG TPA: hypothetical protein VMF33_05060 [Acidimicrobiales bacterium]|nr:hypothetical protein [Acidimicrobiales bacterium]